MSDLKTLLNEKGCVVVVDSVDPYCLKVIDLIQNFTTNEKQLNLFFVDKQGEKGNKILDQSRAIAKDSLPHIYVSGKLFNAGQNLSSLQNQHAFRNVLVSCGAVFLPRIDKVEEIIATSKVAVFLNSFSPFSLSTQNLLNKIIEGKNMSQINYVFVDEVTDGTDLEQAALYLGKVDNLPVIFAGGEAVGSLDHLQKLLDSYEIYDILGKAGVLQKPAHEKLRELKKAFSILLVGNQYSPFSLSVQEMLENVKLPVGAMSMEFSEELELAAKIETKIKDGPYVFVKGQHINTNRLIEAKKKGTLLELFVSLKAISV